MRFSDTLIIDYSVPEPEKEQGPCLHAETRKAYLVYHRFLSRGVAKVSKLHLLLGISSIFYARFNVRRRSWLKMIPVYGGTWSVEWYKHQYYTERESCL
jgi:hypothetical protein